MCRAISVIRTDRTLGSFRKSVFLDRSQEPHCGYAFCPKPKRGVHARFYGTNPICAASGEPRETEQAGCRAWRARTADLSPHVSSMPVASEAVTPSKFPLLGSRVRF